MREDMFKVIVERQRFNSGNKKASKSKIVRGYYKGLMPSSKNVEDKEDLEENGSISYLPSKITGRKPWGYDRKELNENLNPLKRFIASKVGQKWDDVWSEICKFINSDSTVQKHVLDHAKQYVETNCYFDEFNNVWSNGSQGPILICPINYGRYATFYVEPNTGVLRKQMVIKEKIEKKPANLQGIYVDGGLLTQRQVHKIDGIWYIVQVKTIEKKKLLLKLSTGIYVSEHGKIFDCVIKKDLYTLAKNPYVSMEYYRTKVKFGFEGINDNAILLYGSNKRQLNKKELKQYNLKND